jgi:opacity protein-like surface antigen
MSTIQPNSAKPEATAKLLTTRKLFASMILVGLIVSAAPGARYVSGGAFGGAYIPLFQPDKGNGHTFGIKARIKLAAVLYVEPYFLHTREGDVETIVNNGTITQESGKISSLGANLIIASWLDETIRPYAMIGIGTFKVKDHSHREEANRFGSNWGAGVEYTLIPKRLFLDLNAQLQFIDMEGGSQRKAIVLCGGLNWYFKISQ